MKEYRIPNGITLYSEIKQLGSENNINETRSEIDSLIREIDTCISQLSD